MTLTLGMADDTDVTAIVALRAAIAADLTQQHGRGPWSSVGTEAGVRRAFVASCFVLARRDAEVVGALRLATRKPWAIDTSYFTPGTRPLYLLDKAVAPNLQGRGLGRRLLDDARQRALAWPSDAIRLDAYDTPAGAGPFYAKCGYREVGRATCRKTPLVYYELVLQDGAGETGRG